MELFREIYPTAFHVKFLERGLRADGRDPSEVRPLAASSGSLSTALGSSFVRLGRTTVMVGIKGELVSAERKEVFCVTHVAWQGPVADAGVEVHVELSSVCNGERPGLPSGLALWLQACLSHALCGRGREAVSREQLTVDAARDAAWVLSIDVFCIDDDGAMLDAMVAASVAALDCAVLPRLQWNKESGRFEERAAGAAKEGKRLVLANRPFARTFAVIDRWTVADPSHDEESVAGALVSVVCDAGGTLARVEKRGGTAMDRAQLAQCVAQLSWRNNQEDKGLLALIFCKITHLYI